MIMMKMKILVSMMISKITNTVSQSSIMKTVKLKNSFVLTSQYSLLYNHDIL
jgi:hypothetical protein